jgi:hypothetical protein
MLRLAPGVSHAGLVGSRGTSRMAPLNAPAWTTFEVHSHISACHHQRSSSMNNMIIS